MQTFEQTEVMQRNLQRIISNENYFSCLLGNSRGEEQPTNPLRKKMFDKNLRRSTMSCRHYQSASNHNQSQREETNNSYSPRKSLINKKMHISQQQVNHQQMPNIRSTQKITLSQSRHQDPHKQQITLIINNFRLQLDYLQEKLHKKIDGLKKTYQQNLLESIKDRQVKFMIESLERIVGFMIENCVNLEENVMCGGDTVENSVRQNVHVMRKQIYQIQDACHQRENISFGEQNHKKTQRNQDRKGKKKIAGMMEKENYHYNNQQNQIPSTFLIDGKLHINENCHLNKSNKDHNKAYHQDHSKVTHKAQSKQKNTRNSQSSQDFHYQSNKQNFSHNYSSSTQQHSQPIKSIYETVLQERQMRMKMKKKMI